RRRPGRGAGPGDVPPRVADGQPLRPRPRNGRGVHPLDRAPPGDRSLAPPVVAADAVAAGDRRRRGRDDRPAPPPARRAGRARLPAPGAPRGARAVVSLRPDPAGGRVPARYPGRYREVPRVPRAARVPARGGSARHRWLTRIPASRTSTWAATCSAS